jgi:hypothetical protein
MADNSPCRTRTTAVLAGIEPDELRIDGQRPRSPGTPRGVGRRADRQANQLTNPCLCGICGPFACWRARRRRVVLRRFLQGSRRRPDDAAALPPRPPFNAGDLVSVLTEDGQFGVMKVLVVDNQGVHVRLYAQRFKERPQASNLHDLSTAPVETEHGNPFSFGHLPFTCPSFLTWEPQTVGSEPVTEEELKGYRMWQKADGGYF